MVHFNCLKTAVALWCLAVFIERTVAAKKNPKPKKGGAAKKAAANDPCASNPCGALGTCSVNGKKYTCQCPAYHAPAALCRPCLLVNKWGTTCENDCGGCAISKRKVQCTRESGCIGPCRPGWKNEPKCNFIDCNENPCQNGGTCKEGRSQCNCKARYFGKNCEYEGDIATLPGCVKHTDPFYCQNGGICLIYKNKEKCFCSAAWAGTKCTKACEKGEQNCMHGECEGETCKCKSGYKGDFCNQVCSQGRWGKDCEKLCGKCKDSKPCDPETAKCAACEDGFEEPFCAEDGSAPSDDDVGGGGGGGDEDDTSGDNDDEDGEEKEEGESSVMQGEMQMSGQFNPAMQNGNSAQFNAFLQSFLGFMRILTGIFASGLSAFGGPPPPGAIPGQPGGAGGIPGQPGIRKRGVAGKTTEAPTGNKLRLRLGTLQLREGSVKADFTILVPGADIEGIPDANDQIAKAMRDNIDQMQPPEGFKVNKSSIVLRAAVKLSEYFKPESIFKSNTAKVLIIALGLTSFFVLGALVVLLKTRAENQKVQLDKKNKKSQKSLKKSQKSIKTTSSKSKRSKSTIS